MLESSGLGEKGVLFVLTLLFTHLEFGWGAYGQPVFYYRMASQGSDNIMLSPCPPLIGHPMFVQV